MDSYQMGGSASSPDEHLLAEQSVGSEGGLTQSPRGTKKKKKKLRSTRAPAAGSAKSKKDLESQSAAPKKTMKELAAEEAAYRKKERLTILRVIITLVIIAAVRRQTGGHAWSSAHKHAAADGRSNGLSGGRMSHSHRLLSLSLCSVSVPSLRLWLVSCTRSLPVLPPSPWIRTMSVRSSAAA